MIDANQVRDNFAVFCAGAAFGIFAYYMVKIALIPQWEAIKKVAYRIWDDTKSLASKAKFW
jgi:hypothetical protein